MIEVAAGAGPAGNQRQHERRLCQIELGVVRSDLCRLGSEQHAVERDGAVEIRDVERCVELAQGVVDRASHGCYLTDTGVRARHRDAKRRDAQQKHARRQHPERRRVRPGQRRTLREDERSDRRREDRQHLRGALNPAQVRRTKRPPPDREEEHGNHASGQPDQRGEDPELRQGREQRQCRERRPRR